MICLVHNVVSSINIHGHLYYSVKNDDATV